MPTYVAAAVIAFCWAVWPMIAKQTGVSSGWVILAAQIVSLVAIIPFIAEMRSSGVPSPSQTALLLCAGLVNGVGLYLYLYKGMDPGVRIDLFITVVFALLVVVAPIVRSIIFKELPTLAQCIGSALIIAGICIARS